MISDSNYHMTQIWFSQYIKNLKSHLAHLWIKKTAVPCRRQQSVRTRQCCMMIDLIN